MVYSSHFHVGKDIAAWLLGTAFAATFFLGLAPYGFRAGIAPPPLYYFVLLGALSLPLLFRLESIEGLLRSRVLLWAVPTLAYTALSFGWSSQSQVAIDELARRTLSVLFLVFGTALLSNSAARKGTLAVLTAGIPLALVFNIVDLVRPLSFSEVFGRSAGLYGNPNVSGMAVLFALTLTISGTPKERRGLPLAFAAAAVVLTLSRGVLLSFALATACLGLANVIPWRVQTRTYFRMIALGVAIAIVAQVGFGLIDTVTPVLRSGTLSRITDLSVTTGGVNYSTNERMEALKGGIDLFVRHPFVGAGVGATNEMSIGVSTHNIYVKQLAEYGPFGLLSYFGFVALLVTSARKLAGGERIGLATAVVLAVLGLFSHNMLDEWSLLVAYSAILATPQEVPTIGSRTEILSRSARSPAKAT